jgi:hypothetical protein
MIEALDIAYLSEQGRATRAERERQRAEKAKANGRR